MGNLYSYLRVKNDEKLFIMINNSDQKIDGVYNCGDLVGKWMDLLSEVEIVSDENGIPVRLDKYSGTIFKFLG